MKLKILISLLFFIIFQSKADQIYELIKIPNLKIYKIDKESNLRYLTPEKDFLTNSGINNVSCKKSNILYTLEYMRFLEEVLPRMITNIDFSDVS